MIDNRLQSVRENQVPAEMVDQTLQLQPQSGGRIKPTAQAVGGCVIEDRAPAGRKKSSHYNQERSLVTNTLPSGVFAFSHNLESKYVR